MSKTLSNGKLHTIKCDLCETRVEREWKPTREYGSRTDVGYNIPAGFYFAGTASDPAPFALLGWATFTVVGEKLSTDRSEIEGGEIATSANGYDLCPKHATDVLLRISELAR